MGAPRNSTRDRRICFEAHKREDAAGKYLICYLCQIKIRPATEEWEADHIRRHAEDGGSTGENLWPVHVKCHKVKTNTVDKKEIAKGKRVKDKVFGIRKTKRPMPGSRASNFKRKMNGQVERRK